MGEYADFVFCNESEAAAYGKKHELGEDLKEVALKIASSPKKNSARPRTVIFTQGSESTIVACNGKVEEFTVTPLPMKSLWIPMGLATPLLVDSLQVCWLRRMLAQALKQDIGQPVSLFNSLGALCPSLANTNSNSRSL